MSVDTNDKKFNFHLCLILGICLLLRMAGIGFGLPFIYHQDEPILVNHAMALGVTGPNPHFFVIPSFSIYFLFALYAGFFVVGKAASFFQSTTDFAVLFLKDPSFFYFFGRLFLGAFCGTLTAWVLALWGREHFSRRTGLVAALLLAVCPLHIEQSHYIYADVPLSFAVALLFYFLFRISKNPTLKNYCLLGVVFGFGLGVKYTMAYFLPVIFIAHFSVFRKKILGEQSMKRAALSGASSALAFFAVAPFIFLDAPEAIRAVIRQSGAEAPTGLLHHLTYSVIGGTSPLFFALALGGGLWFFKQRRSGSGALISGILIYYGISMVFSQHAARYALPLIPLLCILAALGWQLCEERLRRQPLLLNLAFIFLFTSLLLPSIYMDILFLRKDTRTECFEWVLKNIPQGARIAVDNRFYAPHLLQSKEQIEEKYQFLGEGGKDPARRSRIDLALKAIGDRKTYEVFTLSQDPENGYHPFLFQRPFVGMSLEALKKAGIQYIIFNYSEANLAAFDLRRSIAKNLEKVVSFSPYKDPGQKFPVDVHASTAATHLKKDLLGRVSWGPYLEVYRLND